MNNMNYQQVGIIKPSDALTDALLKRTLPLTG